MHTNVGELMRKKGHSRGGTKKSLVAYRADRGNIIYMVLTSLFENVAAKADGRTT
jgi:hypothetical protein